MKMIVDKTCFQQDMTDGEFKDLTRRTASDKIFLDKAFNIAKNPKCDGYVLIRNILMKNLLHLHRQRP